MRVIVIVGGNSSVCDSRMCDRGGKSIALGDAKRI